MKDGADIRLAQTGDRGNGAVGETGAVTQGDQFLLAFVQLEDKLPKMVEIGFFLYVCFWRVLGR